MQILVVLVFDVSAPEKVVEILDEIDPARLPHFAGTARVVVGEHVDELNQWLDAKDPDQDRPGS